MAAFDIFSSIAFGLSTWPIPRESTGVYAPLGTVATCSAQGFFVQAGIASPFYKLMFSLYFLLQVNFGMSESQISKRAEPIMHGVSIIFALGTSFLCLGMNLFNESSLWCWINAVPNDCEQSYSNGGQFTDCERGNNAEIYRWVIFFGPLWAAVIGTMIAMGLLIRFVKQQEKKMGQYQFARKTTDNNKAASRATQNQRKEEVRIRTKQSQRVTHQALRYVGAFYLTWTFGTINRIMQAVSGTSYFWLMALHTFFVPLQGFFNYLVFSYPKYKRWNTRRKQNASTTASSQFGYSGTTNAIMSQIGRYLGWGSTLTNNRSEPKGGKCPHDANKKSGSKESGLSNQNIQQHSVDDTTDSRGQSNAVSCLCDLTEMAATETHQDDKEVPDERTSNVGTKSNWDVDIDEIDDCVCISLRNISADRS